VLQPFQSSESHLKQAATPLSTAWCTPIGLCR
jgi:hypothetical protein